LILPARATFVLANKRYFTFFAAKLSHLIINNFFLLCVTSTQTLEQKSEEKSFVESTTD